MKNWRVVQLILPIIFLVSCRTSFALETPTNLPEAPPSQSINQPTVEHHPTEIFLFIEPDLPKEIFVPTGADTAFRVTDIESEANLVLQATSADEAECHWFYVIVAPFKTIADDVEYSDFLRVWAGDKSETIMKYPLLVSQNTKNALSRILGEPSPDAIQVVDENILLEPWPGKENWAIVPFDLLQPTWKVISVDGLNPLDKQISHASYPLVLSMGFTGEPEAKIRFIQMEGSGLISIRKSNRILEELATVILTGTTALTRDTAALMDEKGSTYPSADILEWLQSADILHISHEISFMPDCDLADRLKFCSKTGYLELLDHIGTDVIELTGNHLLDFGEEPFLYSLDLYEDLGILTYGGGKDPLDARQPALFDVNNNKIAFVGCNVAGPESAWATLEKGGVNPCDRAWLAAVIPDLQSQGYNVIVTLQDLETCEVIPPAVQRGNFVFAAQAGAVIVSGSQAHCPQSMEFIENAFVHYGLGNLFFDQMDSWQSQEFIDRYSFYKGDLISIELLSAKLEEGGKPRPMSEEERENFLYRIFFSEP